MLKKLGVAALVLLTVSCGGGGGGGGGASHELISASGTSNLDTEYYPDQYSFGATLGRAYRVVVTPTSGDAVLDIETASAQNYASALKIAYADDPEDASFISNASRQTYVWVYPYGYYGSVNYSVTAYNNHLSSGGEYTDTADYQTVYYSFDVVKDKAYRVTLTPSVGSADLSVYSDAAPDTYSYDEALVPHTLLDSSNNATGTDEVSFIAQTSGIYYIAVETGAAATYTVGVKEVSTKPDLSVTLTNVVSNANSVDLSYQVFNHGLSYAPPFDIHFVGNSASTPAANTTSNTVVSVSNGLGAGASTIITVKTVDVSSFASGTAYAIVDPLNVVAEDDETNNVSNGIYWVAPLAAPQTVDFENGQAPIGFLETSTSRAPWAVDSYVKQSGLRSFKSGALTNSGTSSCFETRVTGTSSVSFGWQVDAGSSDYLKFYIDGTPYDTIYGGTTAAWTTPTYTVSNTTNHTLKWCYTMQSYTPVGVNAGWVDNIVLTP